MKTLIVLICILSLSLACSYSPFAAQSVPDADPDSGTGETSEVMVTDNPTDPPSSGLPTSSQLEEPPVKKEQVTTGFDPAKAGSSEKDITYCTMEGQDLLMDVYYPGKSSRPTPLILYVHGGAWIRGDKSTGANPIEIKRLNQAGFLVASIDYRLAPEHQFPAQIEDAKCAVRYFRAHAELYNLDPDKIGVWGGSAGGHLVSLLGTSDESAGWDLGEYLDQSSRVQAVVDMYGPSDLSISFEGEAGSLSKQVFGATGADDPVLAAASPVTYVSPDDPPFLILHGDQDVQVPLEHSLVLNQKLEETGVPSELIIVKNGGHGFAPVEGQNIIPGRQEINAAILKFFERTLK